MLLIRLRALCVCCVAVPHLLAQLPQFAPVDVVNAASHAQPISPGALVSIFGESLAGNEVTASGSTLPTELGGTSVTVNRTKAPLLFVSPRQINLQVPWSTWFYYYGNTTGTVVVTTPSGSSAPAAVPVNALSPAVFTNDGSGCGQALAINVAPDGSRSWNSVSNSAAPGDTIELLGTGLGIPHIRPPDGAPAAVSSWDLPSMGSVAVHIGSPDPPMGGAASAGPLSATAWAGVERASIQIPKYAREGCAVPIRVQPFLSVSPAVSISVSSTRGQCVDPASQSFGEITFLKTVTSGTPNDGESESFTANFFSGPNLTRPEPAAQQVPAGDYLANIPTVIESSRSCAVAGYQRLSAGRLRIEEPGGSFIEVDPGPVDDGVSYSRPLPGGFIAGGSYSLAAGGAEIGEFGGHVTIGSPIQIEGGISRPAFGGSLSIKWTGGEPRSVVKVSLVSSSGFHDEAYAEASAGSVTFTPICSGNHLIVCTFGIPSVDQVIVEQSTGPNGAAALTAPGITDDIRVFWTYRYVFAL